jgi:putative transposase
VGHGHLYQGRFKNFLIQTDRHLLTVIRYVEANALRAGLVERAEEWPWSSVCTTAAPDGRPLISEWPVARPAEWTTYLNQKPIDAQIERLRQSVRRGAPFGEQPWVAHAASTFGLTSTLHPPGVKRGQSPHSTVRKEVTVPSSTSTAATSSAAAPPSPRPDRSSSGSH